MPAGRPPKELDREKIFELASQYCTFEEIAAELDTSVDTIERRFKDDVKQGHGCAKRSVRSKQFEMAMGFEGKPAEFLKDQFGDIIKDSKGDPVCVRSEVKAMAPNVAMLIWLGKQYLGQSEKFQVDGNGEASGFAFVKSREEPKGE